MQCRDLGDYALKPSWSFRIGNVAAAMSVVRMRCFSVHFFNLKILRRNGPLPLLFLMNNDLLL